MLTVAECLSIASPTSGHDAYAHFYLPMLRGKVPSPGQYQLQTLRFTSRDMVDADCKAIAAALKESFDTFGPEQCSATALREIGIAGNHKVTAAGLQSLLQGLLYVARRGAPERDSIDAMEDGDDGREDISGSSSGASLSSRSPLYQLHTLDLSDVAFALTLENQQAAMALIREVPGLMTVRLPQKLLTAPPPVEQMDAVEEGEATSNVSRSAFEAEERAEREHQALLAASPGFSYGVKPEYTADDFARNAELNTFPVRFKRFVLAAGRSQPRVRKARIPVGMDPDDIEREFPKQYNLFSARAMSNVLAHNNSLVLLDFSNNNVGDEATEILAACLSTNKTLVELNLRSNQIGSRGGLALNQALLKGPNTTLLEMDLSDNCINDIVVDAFWNTVKKDVTGLGTLRLEKNCVSPALVTRLYQALMLNTQPKELKRLAPLLEANDSRVSKVALNSGEDHLDDISLKVLLHALRKNTSVTLIDVSNNHITDEGAFFLADMIVSVPSLRKVLAQFNTIGEEGARKLLAAIPRGANIEKVDLKFQEPPIDPTLLQMIDKVAGLSNQPKVVKQLGLALAENDPDVTSLDLSVADKDGRRADDETISTLEVLLQHNTFLAELDLSKNSGRFSTKSFTAIGNIGVRLLKLNLSSNGLKDEDIMEPLTTMLTNPACHMHTLLLDINDLSSHAATYFVDILRNTNDNVTTLTMEGNRRVGREQLQELQFYCDLNTHSKAFKSIILTVEDNQDKRVKTIDLSFVDKLNASGTSHGFRKEFGDLSAKLLCTALARNDIVQTVSMCGNRVTDVGAHSFATLLRNNVTLTHLDLSYNEIGDIGLSAILAALKTNTTIKAFVFEGNRSKNVELSKALHQALQSNTVSAATPYVTAMNMTGATSEMGVDPKLRQFAIDRMVGSAILDDALVDLKKNASSKSPT